VKFSQLLERSDLEMRNPKYALGRDYSEPWVRKSDSELVEEERVKFPWRYGLQLLIFENRRRPDSSIGARLYLAA